MQRITRAQAANRTACATCHRRKIKCDAPDVGVPCSNCKTGSRDDCSIHQKRKRISRSVRKVANAPSTNFPVRPSTEDEVNRSPPGNITVANSSTSSVVAYSEDKSVPSPRAVVGVTGTDLKLADDGEHAFKRYLVEFIDQPELVQRPIDSKARLTYIGNDASNINYLVRYQFGAGVEAVDVCHYPTNRLSESMIRNRQADRIPLDAFQLPQKCVVDELLNAYFRHVNPGFPVVDEDIFMLQYRSKNPANPPSLLLLHAILVVGAHVLYDDDQQKRNSCKSAFFRRAKSLFDAGFERNRDTIVQSALLLTWHTEGVEDVTANAWFWLGVSVRTALGLGMHRDADGSKLVPHNKRMWRRVWWLLFQSDVWISLQYGRPQSIHIEDSNVQKLKTSDFSDCGDHVRPEYQLQMSQLTIIISEATRGRNRASDATMRLAVLRQTDQKLANWALRLPQQLHLHTTPGSDIWSANLHLHYNMALILLHRSQPQAAISDGRSGENTEICVAAAGVIQTLFQNICEAGKLKCLWMSTINCLFTALIQLSTEIRLSNPLLAISALRRYDSALVSLEQLAEYWPNAQSIVHFFKKSVRINSPREQGSIHSREGNKMSENLDRELDEPAKSPNLDDFDLQSPPQAEDCTTEAPESIQVENEYSKSFGDMTAGAEPSCIDAEDAIGHLDGTDEMLDAWKEWQCMHWNTPEFSDELLFTF